MSARLSKFALSLAIACAAGEGTPGASETGSDADVTIDETRAVPTQEPTDNVLVPGATLRTFEATCEPSTRTATYATLSTETTYWLATVNLGDLNAADILRVDVKLCGREVFGDPNGCPQNVTCEGTLPATDLELDCASVGGDFGDGIASVFCGSRSVFRNAEGNVTTDQGSRRSTATFYVYVAD